MIAVDRSSNATRTFGRHRYTAIAAGPRRCRASTDPEDGAMHPNVQAVQDALESAGASGQVRVLPDAVTTAAAAAAALGIEVGQIANSLIFNADDEPLLVLTSGAHRVDTAKVAGLIGATSVKRATPDFVKEHTGQPIGGVAPIGHPKPVRTLVDTALAAYRRGVGGRRDPARRVPHHVRGTGPHDRRHTRGRRLTTTR
jgi:prolyl-tRNA editing enzyme YbaK/EbsC (Cys-tRNA(Pro) deacylase)